MGDNQPQGEYELFAWPCKAASAIFTEHYLQFTRPDECQEYMIALNAITDWDD